MGSGKRTNHTVTIKDVAREAGCSVGAVSFVLHKNHPVSAELRQKVLETVEKLGYRPYRKIVPDKPRVIFLVTAYPFSNEHMRTLQKALKKHGYLLVCAIIPIDLEDMPLYLTSINDHPHAAGVICMHTNIESFELLRYCKRLPSVIYSRSGSMLSQVTLKYDYSGALAARKFVQHGCRQAAVFIFDEKQPTIQPMCESFQKACPGELSTTIIALPRDQVNVETLAPILEDLLNRGINAWFASNEEFCRAIHKWAYQTNHTYPRDFSFIMRDFNDSSDEFLPPITAIAFPSERMLELTVDALLAKINNTTPENVELLPYLIDRGSVGGEGGAMPKS